jgi:hypothetical protein
VNVHRTALGAVAVVASLLTAGCPEEKHEGKPEANTAAAPAPTPTPAPAPTPSATATAAATAAADDTTPPPDPPADQNEAATEGKPPSPHHVWVGGYWHWLNHKYTWAPGYWEDQQGFATAAPPALIVEHAGLAPKGNFSWLPGYHHWNGKEYAWAPGHWAAPRTGFAYAHPTYVSEKGHWVRQGLGWEKEDAAFTKAHPAASWEKHGEIWVQKTEAAEFVKRAEKEGWGKPAGHPEPGKPEPMKH